MQHKDFSRALRRHHYARLKNTRKFYWGRLGHADWTPGRLGMVVATPQLCSCLGCGNSRKWLGERSMQERRAYQVPVWEGLECLEAVELAAGDDENGTES